MKKIILALSGILMLLGSCKETDTSIALTHAPSTDSIYYIRSVTAQQHNVLAEEFSGQGCSNCPTGHAILDAVSVANPGRINAIVLYTYISPQTLPPSGSAHDLRDSTATNILSNIYQGGIGMPSAGIDRTVFGGNLDISYNSKARLLIPPIAGL